MIYFLLHTADPQLLSRVAQRLASQLVRSKLGSSSITTGAMIIESVRAAAGRQSSESGGAPPSSEGGLTPALLAAELLVLAQAIAKDDLIAALASIGALLRCPSEQPGKGPGESSSSVQMDLVAAFMHRLGTWEQRADGQHSRPTWLHPSLWLKSAVVATFENPRV